MTRTHGYPAALPVFEVVSGGACLPDGTHVEGCLDDGGHLAFYCLCRMCDGDPTVPSHDVGKYAPLNATARNLLALSRQPR